MMLTRKNQIRIIKHAGSNDSRPVGRDKRPTSVRSHTETKRDAITVLTEWIGELRRKKAEEAARGFKSLFGKAAES